MPRTDLLQQSATRVELDQRSRDARLRLECVERFLAVYPLRRGSLLRRFLGRFWWRTRAGGKIGRRVNPIVASPRGAREHQPPGDGGGTGDFPMPSSAAWPSCSGNARIGPGHSVWRTGLETSDLAVATGTIARRCFKPWGRWCGRGDLNSHVLSDNRF